MQNPKVSIVLPVHNGEKYLAIALDSILKQTFTEWELIIINDASTDASFKIAEKYANNDERIMVINVSKQKALADVLNIGIESSKSSYIVRMDADDVMLPNRLEMQYKYMLSNPEVIVCGSAINLINVNGEFLRRRDYALRDNKLKRNIFLFSPFAHPSVIIKKDALVEVGGYTSGLKGVEDIDLWFRLSGKGDFANIGEVLLEYRVNESSESLGRFYEHFKLTDELRKSVIKDGLIKPDFRQNILMFIQRVIVNIVKIFPESWVMTIFEFGRRVVSKL
jgi:glycosyltransferase involved in cell wall biosynthesis